ncbi:MAG: hypothetical protein ACRDOE_14165, partial [Streptosporangiaceae bacterium]
MSAITVPRTEAPGLVPPDIESTGHKRQTEAPIVTQRTVTPERNRTADFGGKPQATGAAPSAAADPANARRISYRRHDICSQLDTAGDVEEVDANVCVQMPLFASAEAAQGWLAAHPSGSCSPPAVSRVSTPRAPSWRCLRC